MLNYTKKRFPIPYPEEFFWHFLVQHESTFSITGVLRSVTDEDLFHLFANEFDEILCMRVDAFQPDWDDEGNSGGYTVTYEVFAKKPLSRHLLKNLREGQMITAYGHAVYISEECVRVMAFKVMTDTSTYSM